MKKFAVMTLSLVAAVSVLPAAASAANDGKNRRVVVENESSQSLYYLYASPISSNSWEEDLLGNSTISAHAQRVANIDNGTNQCQYDMKVKFANGREVIRRNVNVCAVSRWVIDNRGDSFE